MLHDPFLMKDMDKAVSRLIKAMTSKEQIRVYGDYDVDGTTSVSMMYLFLKSQNANCDYYIPDRDSEGYGISYKGIDDAIDNVMTLMISLDCCIKAVEKVAYAKSKGLDLIICDHHRPGAHLPDAIAVLDPKRVDCTYPFKELCGCGVGFKLIQAYLKHQGLDETIEWFKDNNNTEVSKIYNIYVGMPLAEIPSPDGKGSYDRYFLKPFFQSLETVGVFPEVVENYNSYKKGNFADCTKLFVDNKQETREILEKISGRQLPKKWFPWTFLDNDGTLTDGDVLNVEWPNVTFLNKEGEQVTNDMSKGEGKLPWRLDWPAKWKILNVTFEAFGKDHATKGGSYDTGKELSEKILDSRTPLDMVYEWIHLKGKGAMHSSTAVSYTHLTLPTSDLV